MAKKFTVEMKGQALKDLEEIAGLCKETPEDLLVRAFREWVQLREDLADIEAAHEALEEYEREGGVSHEAVGAELKAKRRSA
jgi:hypothetical protein